MKKVVYLSSAALGMFLLVQTASADQVILDDLIVDGSACIGQDCVNGESFGFDTIRLKENNLRIRFFDTSNSASFPTNDWQLTANSSDNGGGSFFSIDDIDGGRTPFKVEAGAPTDSLRIDSGGRIGFGVDNPVVELHLADGDTPTLRLEQDGSSGFTPQTWDLAGNEASFFIRDVTHGSTLPFRVFPDAPSSSLAIEGSTGDIGIGTTSPTEALDIVRNSSAARIQVTGTSGDATQIIQRFRPSSGAVANNNNLGQFSFRGWNGSNYTGTRAGIAVLGAQDWAAGSEGTRMIFTVTANNTGTTQHGLRIENDGDVYVPNGDLYVGSTQLSVPDYVFEDDYNLLTLSELKSFIEEKGHLPGVPSANEVNQAGTLNINEWQMSLLEKIEELTLYTLQQEESINEISAKDQKISKLQQENAELKLRLSKLENIVYSIDQN